MIKKCFEKCYLAKKTVLLLGVLCLILLAFDNYSLADECNNDCNEEFVLPDSVEIDEAIRNKYNGRVIEEERDLYSFVFTNADGGYTMRTFGYPVKYVTNSGEVKDISLCLEESDYGFFTKDHPVEISLPRKITNGINIHCADIDVLLLPSNTASNSAYLTDNNRKVVYDVDDNTQYIYSLTCCGLKEEIVVSKYNGTEEFEYVLFTNGLHPIEIDNEFFLADNEENIKAFIGDVFVITADDKNNTFGKIQCEQIEKDSKYLFRITIDKEFLCSDNTTYPIIIDPTIEINYSNNGSGAIQDVTINQNSTYSGSSGSLYVGRHDDGSLSRILMRFPYLNMPVKFGPLIISAQIELRDLMCQSNENMTICCYSYSESSPYWSESSTTTWSSVGSTYLDTLLDSKLITYNNGNVSAQRYGFNITNLAKQWADGIRNPAKGIAFTATDSFEGQSGSNIQYWKKTFASYNRSTYKPSLTIRYDKKAIFTVSNNAYGTKYLTASGAGVGGAIFSSNLDLYNGNKLWCIEYISNNASLSIVSLGLRYVGGDIPYVIYNDSSGAGLAGQNVSLTNQQYTAIFSSGSSYYFKNKSNNRYLSVLSDGVLSSSSTQNNQSKVSVSRINTSSFNNFFSGIYNSGIYSGVVYIKIQLDSSILSNSLYANNDFSSALWWNGVTDNIRIYGPNETVPNGIVPFIVTFSTDASNSFGTHTAVTLPNGITYGTYEYVYTEQEKDALISSNWNSVTIYLNGRTGNLNPFNMYNGNEREKMINKVICHEMGHALKLAHPMQPNNDGQRHYFVGCRGNYAGNESVYAIMNQGSFNDSSQNILTAAFPQDHDYINLISKWEYHQSCSH